MAGSSATGSAASCSKISDKENKDDSGNKMQAGDEWFEAEIRPDLKLSFALKRVIIRHKSNFQEIVLLDTKGFGRVLVIDGKPQSAEADGFIYYESLVHPALLLHDNPKRVFIMGGGEGSAAREVLKHKTIERVVLCDKDKDVVDLCRLCFEENWGAFLDPRLKVVISDARAELENKEDKFDVIIGDLPDPIEGGSCHGLYTKSFYQSVIKPRLNDGGIFVTQAGPAGISSHKVFTSIFNTLQPVFQHIVAITVAVPLHADTCGWVLASDKPLEMNYLELDQRISDRINGELRYHDGISILAAAIVNKLICKRLSNYSRYYIDEDATVENGGKNADDTS